MQVSLEIMKGLERKLNMELPKEKLADEYKKRVQQVARTASIKGFRPGKVPLTMVEKRYGNEIRSEAMTDLIRNSLNEALAKENIRLAGEISIQQVKAEPDQNIQVVAAFEVLPTIKLIDLKGVEIEKLSAQIGADDIKTTVENLRKKSVEWQEVNRAAKKEDQVTLSCDAFKADKALQNTKLDHRKVVIGSGAMPPEFENALEGKKSGDEFTVEVAYPKEHSNKEIAGEMVTFKGKVHQVCESKLPEINEDFIKRLGIEGGIEGLEKEVRETMEHELGQMLKNLNKQTILNKILEMHHDLELPKGLLQAEIKSLHHGHHHAEGEACGHQEGLEQQAKRRVALGLLVGELAQQHQIKVDPQRVGELVQNMAMYHAQPQEMIKWYYEDQKRLAPFTWIVLEDQVAEKLLELVLAKEKSIPYADIVKRFQEMQQTQGG
jgi:trigger factor